MLKILLFGNLKIMDGETALPPLTPPKVSALLAYLLLRREHAIPRDQAAFTLWADSSEAEARSNLRRHLHLLRRALPEPPADCPWLIAEHETLQWNRGAEYWLDIDAFEHALDGAQLQEGDSIASLQAALDCYHGDLLENFYEDWVLDERQRLRERFASALERIGALHEAGGDLRGAIAASRRLLTHEPLREEAHRRLMQLYYWAGDRAAALQQYEDCKRLMQEKLSVEPMAETRSLRAAIADSQLIPRQAMQMAASAVRPGDANAAAAAPRATSKPEPSRVGARRWPVWVGWVAGLLVAAFVLLRFSTGLFASTESIAFSGPRSAQDTWLSPQFPDSTLDPNFPENIFADFSQVHLQYYDAGDDRFIIRFDLSAAPANIQVKSATLSIHFETWISTSGQDALQRAYPAQVTAYRILQPWEAATATFNAPWSQPGLMPGADHDVQALDTQLLNDTGWLVFNVTPAVLNWLSHPNENWGVMLKITSAPEGVAHYWVDTTQHPTAELRPRLTITYSP